MRKPKLLVLQGRRNYDLLTYAESDAVREVFDVEKSTTLDGHSPDLVYTQNFGPFLDLPDRWKGPYVVHMGGNPWLEMGGTRLARADRMLSKAAAVMCVSNFLVAEIRKNMSRGRDRVFSLPGGLWGQDHTTLGPSLARFEKKTDYKLGEPPVVLMSIGLKDDTRLENKWRGIPVFLEAVKDVSSKFGVKFLCSARGSYEFSRLGEWGRRYNFKFVRFHHIDDVVDRWPEILRCADLFVHPGTYDCWPRVIAEAMLVGLPCMAFDVTGNAEVGDTVWKFKPGESHLIRQMFQSLIGNEDLRRVTGEVCREEALAKTERHRGDYASMLLVVYQRAMKGG